MKSRKKRKKVSGRKIRKFRRKMGLPVKLPSYAGRDKLLREMGYSSYREYLNSPLWFFTRKEVLEKHEHKCVLCGSETNTVHHLSYAKQVLLGNDKSQLVPLCYHCHRMVEMDGDRKRLLEEARQLYFYLKKLKEWEDSGYWVPFRVCCRCRIGSAYRGRRVCVFCMVRKRAFTRKFLN